MIINKVLSIPSYAIYESNMLYQHSKNVPQLQTCQPQNVEMSGSL